MAGSVPASSSPFPPFEQFSTLSREIDMPQVYDGDPPIRERVVYRTREVVKSGVGFGSALAIAISWSANHSILWAIVHGILSWLYVIYYAFTQRT